MDTNMDSKPSPVELFDLTVMKDSVGVCQSPNRSMAEKTKVLVEKACNWIRKIVGAPTKLHLAWKRLKCGIWHLLAYILTATTLSWAQEN